MDTIKTNRQEQTSCGQSTIQEENVVVLQCNGDQISHFDRDFELIIYSAIFSHLL